MLMLKIVFITFFFLLMIILGITFLVVGLKKHKVNKKDSLGIISICIGSFILGSLILIGFYYLIEFMYSRVVDNYINSAIIIDSVDV